MDRVQINELNNSMVIVPFYVHTEFEAISTLLFEAVAHNIDMEIVQDCILIDVYLHIEK